MSFFGTNRKTSNTKEFASPDYVSLTFAGAGGVVSGLASSIRAVLNQQIEDIYVIGEPTVYFGAGATQGTVEVSRYAKAGDLFKGLRGSACGVAQSISLSSTGGGSECSGGGVSATFSGAQIQGINLDIQAGRTSITEGLTFRIIDME